MVQTGVQVFHAPAAASAGSASQAEPEYTYRRPVSSRTARCHLGAEAGSLENDATVSTPPGTVEYRRLLLSTVAEPPADAGTVMRANSTASDGRAGALALALPSLAKSAGVRLWEVRPLDESLEALFRELVR